MPEGNQRIPYFGDFVLFGEIGRGGMGVVYDAHQLSLDRPVALKVLHSNFAANEAAAQRLRIEAEAVARLDHPNIVPIIDIGEHEGHSYLAMQRLEGENLAEQIARLGPNLKERDAAVLMAKIARAVYHAHQHGVLHRDLKPGNVIVDESGEPHLIDFGLAKCLEKDAGITQTGAFLGTPAYASPEQAAGNNKLITTASDIYSLGAILYALLTGQPPFVGDSTAETIEKVKNTDPIRPRSVRPTLSTNLETICLKCLKKKSARRYGSALELAEEIERFLDGRPIAARPVGAFERLWMWTRRNPVHAALGITVFLGLLASSAGVFLWRKDRADVVEALSQINQVAETRNQFLRRQALLGESKETRLMAHNEGWSVRALAPVNEAVEIQTIEKSSDLRNQAAALLAGLDVHRVEPFTNFGASSVAFDREGRRLLIGGWGDAAKLWDGKTGKLEVLSQTNSERLAFADDAPVELRYDPNSRSLVLSNLGGPRTRREWKIPEQIGSIKVGTNAPVKTAITPDGIYVATVLALVDGNQAVIVSHSNTFKPVGVLASPISQLAISQDGSLVAAAHSKNRISVWSVSNRSRLAELPTDRDEILCLAFKRTTRVLESPNPESDAVWLLAAGDSGGKVTLWDLHTQVAKAHYRGGHFGIGVIAISPDGTILASGGRGPVKLWDVATERLLLDVPVGGSGEFITGLDFAPDGKRLAISTAHGTPHPKKVSIWNLEYGRGIQTLRGLSGQISKICFSADGQKFAALAHNWEVGVWDLASGQLLRVFEAPRGGFADNAALAFSPDGKRLAFSASTTAKMWDVQTGVGPSPWVLPPGLVDMLGFPDEDHLLLFRMETLDGKLPPDNSAPRTNHPRVCRIRDLLRADALQPTAEIRDFNWHVYKALPILGGRGFVVEGKRVEGDKETVMFKSFDGFTGKELWTIPSNKKSESSLLVSDASGKLVAFGKEQSPKITLTDASSGATVEVLDVSPLAISLDSRLYAVGDLPSSRSMGVSLLNHSSSKPLVTLGIDAVASNLVHFDAGGTRLAWGNTDGTVTVCDLNEINKRLNQISLAW